LPGIVEGFKHTIHIQKPLCRDSSSGLSHLKSAELHPWSVIQMLRRPRHEGVVVVDRLGSLLLKKTDWKLK